MNDINKFECIIIDNHIWFPNRINYSPQSHGMHRRKAIFQKTFPDFQSSICNEQIWNRLKEEREVQTFIYDETTKKLTKMEEK